MGHGATDYDLRGLAIGSLAGLLSFQNFFSRDDAPRLVRNSAQRQAGVTNCSTCIDIEHRRYGD